MLGLLVSLTLTLSPINGGTTPQTPQRNALPGPPPEVIADGARLVAWVTAQHDRDIQAWVAGVVAGEAALEAQRAAEWAPVARQMPTPVSGPCGGATNGADQFIARESGGDPTAENPSGAWGCYQIMPGTWAGSCSDLGDEHSASPAVQAQCASRLPLSAWGG